MFWDGTVLTPIGKGSGCGLNDQGQVILGDYPLGTGLSCVHLGKRGGDLFRGDNHQIILTMMPFMRMKNLRLLCLSVYLIVYMISCGKPLHTHLPDTPPNNHKDGVTTLKQPEDKSKNHDECAKALATLQEYRPDWDARYAQVAAAKLLGESRSMEAVPILLDKLMTIGPPLSDNVMDDEETFPASEALVQIGAPAVSQVVLRFERASNKSEELILLRTLEKIKGRLWVSDYLEHLITSQSTKKSKNDLVKLKMWVSSLK